MMHQFGRNSLVDLSQSNPQHILLFQVKIIACVLGILRVGQRLSDSHVPLMTLALFVVLVPWSPKHQR